MKHVQQFGMLKHTGTFMDRQDLHINDLYHAINTHNSNSSINITRNNEHQHGDLYTGTLASRIIQAN
jgi:hypothetical protein